MNTTDAKTNKKNFVIWFNIILVNFGMQFVDDYDSQFIGQTGIKYDHQATDVLGLLYQSGTFNHGMQAADSVKVMITRSTMPSSSMAR